MDTYLRPPSEISWYVISALIIADNQLFWVFCFFYTIVFAVYIVRLIRWRTKIQRTQQYIALLLFVAALDYLWLGIHYAAYNSEGYSSIPLTSFCFLCLRFYLTITIPGSCIAERGIYCYSYYVCKNNYIISRPWTPNDNVRRPLDLSDLQTTLDTRTIHWNVCTVWFLFLYNWYGKVLYSLTALRSRQLLEVFDPYWATSRGSVPYIHWRL